MKRFALTAFLCITSGIAMAQGMFGAQAGIGRTIGYDSKTTPAVEAYYLHKISHSFYAGGSVFFQRYSLTNNLNTGGSIAYGDVISVSQKSSYLYLSPKLDYGIGYRKYLHVHATFGAGFLAGGGQWSNTHSPYWTPPGGAPYGADTIAVNTTYNIPSVLLRFGFGLTERIPTSGYWNITLSQEIGTMSGGISKGPYPIQAPYISFQVGIMHKYPMVFVEY